MYWRVKHQRIYTSTPIYALMACVWTTSLLFVDQQLKFTYHVFILS